MAYTYNDFVTAATAAGLLDSFSEEELRIAQSNPEYGLSALKLTQDLQGATTMEQQLLAQEALNQLKQTYGSFGIQPATGTDGATVYQQALQEAEGGGSFAYSEDAAHQELLESVTNPSSFSYDPAQDSSYAALRKSYLREGERSREDTLAKAAAAMGGVPSSYAVTAAQQSGDYYSGQLADQIPTLEQNAYQRYLSDLGLKQSALAALETDRNFDYQQYLQEQEAALQKRQAAAELMAGVGDYSLYQTLLGLTEEQVAALQKSGSTGGSDYSGPATGDEDTGEDDGADVTAMTFVDNLLYSLKQNSSGADPARVIAGTNQLTEAQKEYAQAYLQALLAAGAMK